MLLLPLLQVLVEVARPTLVLVLQLHGPGLVCRWCWCPGAACDALAGWQLA